VAFDKVIVAQGDKQTVVLTVTPRQMAVLHNAVSTQAIMLDQSSAGMCFERLLAITEHDREPLPG